MNKGGFGEFDSPRLHHMEKHCQYCSSPKMWGVPAHDLNCVGSLSEEQLRAELHAIRSGAKEPESKVLLDMKYQLQRLEADIKMWKDHAAVGYCPACIYSFNGVLDELCDNEFCVEHLREKLIDAGLLKVTDKLYGDR